MRAFRTSDLPTNTRRDASAMPSPSVVERRLTTIASFALLRKASIASVLPRLSRYHRVVKPPQGRPMLMESLKDSTTIVRTGA